MMNEAISSPILTKYLKAYEKNAESRVFAPLAECYRKLGMVEKAIKILNEGIKNHPTYTLGYVGLAYCYYDLKKYELSYNLLRPLISDNRDNLRLQKLYANVCEELGSYEEALETYKYLLYISPRDVNFAKKVKEIEDNVLGPKFVLREGPNISDEVSDSLEGKGESYNIKDIDTRPCVDQMGINDWALLNLTESNVVKKEKEEKSEEFTIFDFSTNRVSIDQSTKEESETTPMGEAEEEVEEEFEEKFEKEDVGRDDDDESFVVKLENEQEAENIDDIPVVTHTLVDLYCSQGHLYKALEILEKILELNPDDEETLIKLSEVKERIHFQEVEKKIKEMDKEGAEKEVEEAKEDKKVENSQAVADEGRSNLMNILDMKMKDENKKKDEIEERIKIIEKKFYDFHDSLKRRANQR